MMPAQAPSARVKAVELRLAGEKLVRVASITGLSAPTIIAAMRAYRAGGWSALAPSRPGRRKQGDSSATAADYAAMADSMASETPVASGLPGRLWNVEHAVAWLSRHRGVGATTRGVRRFLRLSGVLPPSGFDRARAAPDPALREWLNNTYPDLAAQARAAAARLYWVGEHEAIASASRGVASAAARRFVLLAQTPLGQACWRLARKPPGIEDWTDFLAALVQDAGGAVTAILDHPQLSGTKAMRDWLASQNGLLRLLPAPAPTPHWSADPTRQAGQPDSVAQARAPALPTSPSPDRNPTMPLTHLQRLEAESIHIMREVVAEAANPVMLYSIGKDSATMLHLARKAFFPSIPPFPLLHVDTGWKFRDMYALRDRAAAEHGMKLLVHMNPEGLAKGINPFTHGSAIHTDVMKTEGLKQALDKYAFDAAFGGARRDEEKSRAKERIFSFRAAQHRWDPKNQRPELWKLYNTRKHKGESLRVFPLSNWTELDVWQYIHLEGIPIVPLYFAAMRPVVERDGALIMVDDDRMPLKPGEVPMMRKVRFRTLGCYPLTGAVLSSAATLPEIIQEMLLATSSERQGRVIDHDGAASMEKKKQEGYF
jgi:sulfate adenylyltransferase subunit 2